MGGRVVVIGRRWSPSSGLGRPRDGPAFRYKDAFGRRRSGAEQNAPSAVQVIHGYPSASPANNGIEMALTCAGNELRSCLALTYHQFCALECNILRAVEALCVASCDLRPDGAGSSRRRGTGAGHAGSYTCKSSPNRCRPAKSLEEHSACYGPTSYTTFCRAHPPRPLRHPALRRA
jgi:hypothetical protein